MFIHSPPKGDGAITVVTSNGVHYGRQATFDNELRRGDDVACANGGTVPACRIIFVQVHSKGGFYRRSTLPGRISDYLAIGKQVSTVRPIDRCPRDEGFSERY